MDDDSSAVAAALPSTATTATTAAAATTTMSTNKLTAGGKAKFPEFDNNNNKRPKLQPAAAVVLVVRDNIPPEVWARVCEFLPFKNVILMSSLNRFFMREVVKYITRLHIYHCSELNVAFARRLTVMNKVQQVDVYCLITCVDPDEDEETFSICQETASRVVPFLCEFRHLIQVGLDVDASGIPLGTYFRDSFIENDSVEIIRSLVRSICGAYLTGMFTQKARLFGPAFQAGTFICYQPDGCGLCRMYCRSFPLEQAVNARATCISVRDRLDAIASRPGGCQCLKSKTLVLELLRSNYEVAFHMQVPKDPKIITTITADMNRVRFISANAIVFSKGVMEELEILCRNYFDTKTLEKEEVLEALGGEEVVMGQDIWVVQRYHDKLSELGIPLCKDNVLVVNEENLLSEAAQYI